MELAEKENIESALGKCAFYDCIIQHGEGDDPDSIGAIIKRTERKERGPVNGNEKEWIRQFLMTRRADLVNPAEESTQDEWRQSVDRVDAMIKLLDDGNLDLTGPIRVKTPNHSATIP